MILSFLLSILIQLIQTLSTEIVKNHLKSTMFHVHFFSLQVINARTLSREDKNRSIVQKIALQMNCKMGGSLWSIKIPLVNTMIIGIDSYHDKKSSSVSAFVASTNDTYTRWYSKAVVQNRNEELVHGLVVSFQHALAAYKKYNDKYPQKIIIYR